MTREQFLNGTPFTIGFTTYKGDSTYYYNQKDNYMSKQVRSSIDERVVLDDYACNVTKVTKTSFTAFAYVMRKRVVVRYKFEDLVEFKEGV
jgi:hypothetical protein